MYIIYIGIKFQIFKLIYLFYFDNYIILNRIMLWKYKYILRFIVFICIQYCSPIFFSLSQKLPFPIFLLLTTSFLRVEHKNIE